MAGAIAHIDDLLKEYLLFRGFIQTYKSFENDLKLDRDHAYRVEKIIEYAMTLISTYDIQGLKDYWGYLDRKFFSRLEQRYQSSVRKIEASLLKYYLVNATQNNRQDKVLEFFERYSDDMQGHSDWKEWFILPFIKNPDQYTQFSSYFTKSWVDTFQVTLNNFVAVVFANVPLPSLLKFEEDLMRTAKLIDDRTMLKEQVSVLQQTYLTGSQSSRQPDKVSRFTGSQDVSDDFHLLTPGEPSPPPAPRSSVVPRRPSNLHNRAKSSGFPKSPVALKKKLSDPENPVGGQGVTKKVEFKIKTSSETEKKRSGKKVVLDRSKSLSAEAETEKSSDRIVKIHSVSEPFNGSYDKTDVTDSNVTPNTTRPFVIVTRDYYREHRGSGIVNARFSTGGNLVASSDCSGALRVWSWSFPPTTQPCDAASRGSPVLSLEWAAKQERLLLLGGRDSSVRVLDTDTNRTLCDLYTDPSFSRVVALASSPNGTHFASSSTLGRTSTGGAPTGIGLTGVPTTSSLSSITGPPNANYFQPGKLQYWNLKQRAVERDLPLSATASTPPVAASCLTFNHNGSMLLCGTHDGCVKIFDMRRFDQLYSWDVSSSQLVSLRFSPDETSVYSMAADGGFSQWSIRGNAVRLRDFPSAAAGGRCCFALDAEAQHALVGGLQGARIHRIGGPLGFAESMLLGDESSPVSTVDWMVTERTSVCLTGAADGRVQIATLITREDFLS